jgi:hypothetical protein
MKKRTNKLLLIAVGFMAIAGVAGLFVLRSMLTVV